MIGPRNLVLAVVLVILAATFATAGDVYVAQNAAGNNSGADCADAHSAAWFNSSANWGSGSGQIGPGTTVHLCGTFTGTAGSTMLSIQGSGASGSPVTIVFETGANLTAPYWSTAGAITCSGHNYITIDGNNVGIVKNTANGYGLTYQADSIGLYFSNCSNITVQNLTVTNIYQRNGSTGSDGINNFGIYFDTGCDHADVHGNTINNARGLVFMNYQTVTGLNVYNNTLDHSSWHIIILDNNGSSAASGVNIYNNSLGPHFQEWQDTAQNMHADGIMVSSQNGSATFTNSSIYNNYIHGDMCISYGNCTAYIYLSGASGGMSGVQVFNNLLVNESGIPEANLVLGGSGGVQPSASKIYNNTFVTNVGTSLIRFRDGLPATPATVENNIFIDTASASDGAIGLDMFPDNFSSIGTSNYNDFYSVNRIAGINGGSGPPTYYTSLASWQSASSKDANSSSGNPNLISGTYVPQAGSAAIGLATNLTSLGIAPLDKDKAGLARPSSGTWDTGAYQDPPGSSLTPPTGLSASVH